MNPLAMAYADPTEDQKVALCAYRERHGKRWKSRLLADWLKSGAPDERPELRQLRNSHGPSWLLDYRLP